MHDEIKKLLSELYKYVIIKKKPMNGEEAKE